ncbi:MAG: DUF4372 domain-containing protein, partial [Chitinivibrionales bacterium]|nr:DUF4372 domain-containing protein [Chitinivibrionales bacterium]
MKPTRHKFTILQQVMSIIPKHLVPKISRKYGIERRSRSFSPWSHVVSMVYAQLAHSLSLNDICDSLRNHKASLNSIRGATPPSRNNLSYANRNRDADMAEDLFWETLNALQSSSPKFGFERNYVGIPRRFKRTINIVDSTTIKLVAN